MVVAILQEYWAGNLGGSQDAFKGLSLVDSLLGNDHDGNGYLLKARMSIFERFEESLGIATAETVEMVFQDTYHDVANGCHIQRAQGINNH